MSLIKYRLKRDFSQTNEPKPELAKEPQQRFVVHKHNASQLHYDFRMEIADGAGIAVLKSWAVPKNIPVEKGIKHLAIQTEDHPVSYLDFEGKIPNGNYGAGEVEVWDKGKWGLMKGSFDEGMVKFNLFGEKLKGRYVMIKTRGYDKDKSEDKYWLVWKKQNESLIYTSSP